MLYGPGDVALALGRADGPPAVRELREGVEITRVLGRAGLRQRQVPGP